MSMAATAIPPDQPQQQEQTGIRVFWESGDKI